MWVFSRERERESKRGFTLLEILLVVVTIAILAGIVTAIPHVLLITATTSTAGYTIAKSANGLVTVAVPNAVQSTPI